MIIITNKISFFLLFIIFTNGPIQSQNKDSVTLILKNNQKVNNILDPFINSIKYDNIITTTNKDTLTIKTSYLFYDTILFDNGTLGYNFRKNVQPKESVKKTIFINLLPSICKIIKIEIMDRDKKYIYYFRHKRKKTYTFYKLEIFNNK